MEITRQWCHSILVNHRITDLHTDCRHIPEHACSSIPHRTGCIKKQWCGDFHEPLFNDQRHVTRVFNEES